MYHMNDKIDYRPIRTKHFKEKGLYMLLTLNLTPTDRLLAFGIFIVAIFLIAGVVVWLGRIGQRNKSGDEFDIQKVSKNKDPKVKRPEKESKQKPSKKIKNKKEKQKKNPVEEDSSSNGFLVSDRSPQRVDDFPASVGESIRLEDDRPLFSQEDLAGIEDRPSIPSIKRPQINISELRQTLKPSSDDDIVIEEKRQNPFQRNDSGEKNW